jgi:hypothetical protein
MHDSPPASPPIFEYFPRLFHSYRPVLGATTFAERVRTTDPGSRQTRETINKNIHKLYLRSRHRVGSYSTSHFLVQKALHKCEQCLSRVGYVDDEESLLPTRCTVLHLGDKFRQNRRCRPKVTHCEVFDIYNGRLYDKTGGILIANCVVFLRSKIYDTWPATVKLSFDNIRISLIIIATFIISIIVNFFGSKTPGRNSPIMGPSGVSVLGSGI